MHHCIVGESFFPLVFVIVAVFSSFSMASTIPSWNAPPMDPRINNLGGVPLINETTWTRLYYATSEVGQYAMSPMISFLDNVFLATWKVAPVSEDQAGQLIRFAQSTDGVTWMNSSANGTLLPAPGILFPSMNSTQNPNVALFAEPSVYLNGHAYAAASPTQFCLYPDQYQSVLLLRRVYPGVGKFGPIFWASDAIPKNFEEASARENVTTIMQQDKQTQADIALLTPTQTILPCDLAISTKCEFCVGGCQSWSVADNITWIENERTHYVLPDNGGDILLYRENNHTTLINHLLASYRPTLSSNWSIPVVTNITSDVANLNAGTLPDGRIYLTTNFMVNLIRDPLTLALSHDGWHFTSVGNIGSCWEGVFTNPPQQPLGCLNRFKGGGIQQGLQYPQAIAVTGKGVEGFYVILSQNKEDIWVSHTPFKSLNF